MAKNNSQLFQSNIDINNSWQVTAILAMSLDGKITPARETPARFGSENDARHLEQQVSLCDAVILGAGTIRSDGTTVLVKNQELLAQRQKRQQTPQPINIVCSSSGNLALDYPFFSQPIERILLTTNHGFQAWQSNNNHNNLAAKKSAFQEVLVSSDSEEKNINWETAFREFKKLNLKKIGVLGGAKLLSSLLTKNLIDDMWLTLCPVLFGDDKTTNLTDSYIPFSANLKLLSHQAIDSEIFLHYQIIKPVNIILN